MRAPSSRTRRIISVSAAPVAVLLAGLMVWQGSNAAFSAHSRNVGNSWETGSVALDDDDGGAAAFQVQDLTPGDVGEKCIVVTASSSVPGVVKFNLADLAPNGLEDYIQFKMEMGTGGSFDDCAGFSPTAIHDFEPLSLQAIQHTSYSDGILPWTTLGVASGESMSYRFSWEFDVGSLDQAGINALQGTASSVNLVWELQNT
jgi:hypothetical protein